MSNWIAWTKGLPLKREILQLAKLIDRPRFDVVCLCMLVWEWADDNTIDGYVPDATAETLDAVAGIEGFGQALVDVGWLLENEDSITFPNWDRWNSASAKKRLQEAERQARYRKAHPA
jgi:hypothetical protein